MLRNLHHKKKIKRPLISITKIIFLFQICEIVGCNQAKRTKISSPDSLYNYVLAVNSTPYLKSGGKKNPSSDNHTSTTGHKW